MPGLGNPSCDTSSFHVGHSLPDPQEKSKDEERSTRPVSSKAKPSKLLKRKHQIGTLYFDMKQKEMELAERRAKGMLTKAQTQGKYGCIWLGIRVGDRGRLSRVLVEVGGREPLLCIEVRVGSRVLGWG
ncbi:hypothetical protein HAX54_046193 [Datura stramonium]|uniref:Uncharacterized protein n=1 Tax=Datura stramonium TaxID=4076 RepID=A0ABS8WGL1_DATST|nr:hypothetical protein [Datura stramonium]